MTSTFFQNSAAFCSSFTNLQITKITTQSKPDFRFREIRWLKDFRPIVQRKDMEMQLSSSLGYIILNPFNPLTIALSQIL